MADLGGWKILDAPTEPQTVAGWTIHPADGGSRAGAAIAGAAQGVSFGLADEMKAGVKAAGDTFSGGSFGDNYDKRLDETRGDLAARREAHPVAAYGGEIGGALLVPGGTMKAGAPVALNALRMGATGAAQGALYGFGSGEGDGASRARSAAVGGAVGAATGAAAPYVLKGARALANGRAERMAIDAAADAAPEPASLARQSGALYEKARKAGVVVDATAVEPLVRDLAAVKGLDADFTPDGLKVISRLMQKLDAGDLPLGELEALHRKAGMAVTKNRMSNPADAGAAGEIARRVDEFMMNLPDDAIVANTAGKDEAVETLRQARSLWKQYRNSEKLQEIVANAEMDDNPGAAIKRGFKAILKNKNKRATYSAAEQQVMRQVVMGSKSGSWVQRLIGYGTGLSRQVVGTTAGYGVGGPIGAALGSAAATKIGSMAKDAASDATMAAAGRAARFSAAGGQYARPAPAMLPGVANALAIGQRPAVPAAVNLWNR